MKKLIQKIKEYKFIYEWGFSREELIDNEEIFNWFYCSDNFNICNWI